MPKLDCNESKVKRPDFASRMAAAEFGGRYWGWREWAEFQDRAPDDEPRTIGAAE